jgi:hypothetical protein
MHLTCYPVCLWQCNVRTESVHARGVRQALVRVWSSGAVFTHHLQEEEHSFGSINNIMQVLYRQRKGTYLKRIERFYIHKEHAAGNRLNDDHTIFPNKIFDSLIKNQTTATHLTSQETPTQTFYSFLATLTSHPTTSSHHAMIQNSTAFQHIQ